MILPTTDKPKHTASYYLKKIDENPEKFGTTRTHILSVNKVVKKAEEILEQNSNPSDKIKIDLIIKINNKYAKVKSYTETEITAVFPNKKEITINIDNIKICRKQVVALDKYDAEYKKYEEKQIKKADKEFKKANKKSKKSENKIDISGW